MHRITLWGSKNLQAYVEVGFHSQKIGIWYAVSHTQVIGPFFFTETIRPAIHFSYFTFRRFFTNVFAKHATKYETLAIHFSYSMQISCFNDAKKNKPQNPLTFRTNANPGTKCCEMRKAKNRREMRKKWHEIPRYTLFVFRDRFCIFHDKCIAGLTEGSYKCIIELFIVFRVWGTLLLVVARWDHC